MTQGIVITRPNQVELQELDHEPVNDDAVRVRSRYSLISAGTEGIQLCGEFDKGTHWDQLVRYPYRPGYSTVGVVEETGANMTDLVEGDRVAVLIGHASEHVVGAELCSRIPDDVPDQAACWFALARIALMAARAACYKLGDRVAVIGAGPVGQMSIRWAVAAGARAVVVVDPVHERLTLATAGGVTHVVAAPAGDATREVIRACGGERPAVVVDNTGNAAVFEAALSLAADHGRVVLVGDTGSPARQHLSPDVLTRGLTVVGAHGAHALPRSREWDELFFHLVRSGRFNLDGLNTNVFSPSDCAAAYQTATSARDGSMGVMFDWNTT